MKNKLILTILSCFLINPANCFELKNINIFEKSEKSQIKKTIKEHNSAVVKMDIDKIKTFYDKNYLSSDGFNLDELIEMLEKTHDTYKNIKYKTKINNISTSNNWAVVQMSDSTKAKIYPSEEYKKDDKAGYLKGISSYLVYLKKEDNSWKIISEDILMEETTLKYGIARKIPMELVTPVFIDNGSEYDLSLKMEKPEDIVALASISREEISYPPAEYDEKFRKFPTIGDLERLVKANNKNLDEYAIASVGFTKISINKEETKAKIQVLGMAYLMKRINMQKIHKGEK